MRLLQTSYRLWVIAPAVGSQADMSSTRLWGRSGRFAGHEAHSAAAREYS